MKKDFQGALGSREYVPRLSSCFPSHTLIPTFPTRLVIKLPVFERSTIKSSDEILNARGASVIPSRHPPLCRHLLPHTVSQATSKVQS